jgi:MraZ protein
VEVWPRGQGGRLQARLDALGPFDPERDWLETLLYTDAHQAETDAQGRISLPAELVELAGITDTVSFYGRGDHFQIWEPKAGAVYKEESRARGKAFVFGKPAP